jgi:hypothetical protein
VRRGGGEWRSEEEEEITDMYIHTPFARLDEGSS